MNRLVTLADVPPGATGIPFDPWYAKLPSSAFATQEEIRAYHAQREREQAAADAARAAVQPKRRKSA